MIIKETTVAVILYKSKKLANGEYPLVLRITKNRQRKYKYLGISCSKKLWNSKENKPRSAHPDKLVLDKMIADTISEYKTEILELSVDGKSFTSDSLLNRVEKPLRKLTLFQFFEEIIGRNITANKIGNASVYKDTYSSIKLFLKNTDIYFSDIDYRFLVNWESFQRKTVKEETSLSVRFRTLRSLYNKAIMENIVKQSDYPFNKFKISKFDTSTRKRAITKEDIKKIESLDIPEKTTLFLARQYFLFSYYGLGINFCDIAHLKWNNIIGDRVFYQRMKTGGKEINFKLIEESLAIIQYWKPLTGRKPDNYIFPILDKSKHKTATQIDNRIGKVIGWTNKNLKIIGKKAGISLPLTTYVARHTFATVLKRSGVSTTIISQSMNHKSEGITQVYLNSFENDIIDAAQQNLR